MNFLSTEDFLPSCTLAEVDKELAQRSLREFARQCWHVVEPATPYVHGWHLDAICDHLEAVTLGQIRNLLINMPPRHMKSLAVSVFWPCWVWAIAPSTRWLFSSYAQSLSVRDSLKCREVIRSPWYQANWGSVFSLKDDQDQKMRFENDRTGYRIATSVGGSATGEGGDYLIADDPHNVKEAESTAVRTSVLDWWDRVMSTRGNDPRTVRKVIVMQRVHDADLSGHVLAQGGWDHLCLPAEYEPRVHVTSIGWSDPRKGEGDPLWPERFGVQQIADLKRSLGSYATAGQLQQRPSPAGGGIWQRAWWKRYAAKPAKFDEVIQSWDMAFKDLTSSDFVVGQVWGRVGADCYLLDQVRARLDFPATIQAVKDLSVKWPTALAKLVEDKANGTAVIATLRTKLPGLIAINPQGGKESRAQAVSAVIESGNVFIPESAPWASDFIEECSSFPNGAHDDQVDACSQALMRLTKPQPHKATSRAA